MTIKTAPINGQSNGSYPSSNGITGAVGCGRNCLGKCCLPFSILPLYEYNIKDEDEDDDDDDDSPVDFLRTLLLAQWEEKMRKGLFRYNIKACESKIVPGKYGFIAKLNEGRHLKKRRTEFGMDDVLQPFDPKKFNFSMVGQEEVLVRFEESVDGKTHFFINAHFDPDRSINIVAINVSPIEYGHVLVIPRVLECLSQRIDQESFLLALHMVVEAKNRYFRLGYNSLGAFATINHLHFQAYYLPMQLSVEKALNEKIHHNSTKTKVIISSLVDYPIRGFVFEGGNTLQDLSNMACNACIYLQEKNIPFNFLISESGKKIFIFPQCYAQKMNRGEVSQDLLDIEVNPGAWEISGHIALKQKEIYESISNDSIRRLLKEVSLSSKRFKEVKKGILQFESTNYKTFSVGCVS